MTTLRTVSESDPVVPKKTLHACDAHADMLGFFAESRKLREQKSDAGAFEAGWIVMPTGWAFSQSPENCVNRNVMLGLSKLGGLPCRQARRFPETRKLYEQKCDAGTLEAGWIVFLLPSCS